ncbi:hypothetical protein AMD24_00476 [Candidatus Xiphinematobacter sp. Idaho Grape]|nr:hypothetical protein AMD24_00476 [Candidatus Xiphinematobacter sp. Idaho Grape]
MKIRLMGPNFRSIVRTAKEALLVNLQVSTLAALLLEELFPQNTAGGGS